jgi:hypothetical protein
MDAFIACAGAGKTTLARALAARQMERDGLGDDESPGFAARARGRRRAAGQRWVFDGAPYNAEALVDPHADTVLALDYPAWSSSPSRYRVGSALADRPRRRRAHLCPAVALVDTHAPDALGRGDAGGPPRGDHRAACPARARPHPPPAVHAPRQRPPGWPVAAADEVGTSRSSNEGGLRLALRAGVRVGIRFASRAHTCWLVPLTRFAGQMLMLEPVVFLMLPVVVLFALYPGLFTLSQLAR